MLGMTIAISTMNTKWWQDAEISYRILPPELQPPKVWRVNFRDPKPPNPQRSHRRWAKQRKAATSSTSANSSFAAKMAVTTTTTNPHIIPTRSFGFGGLRV